MPRRSRQKSLLPRCAMMSSQPVVPAVSAAHFQARHTRRQIQFVMHHQHFCRRYLVELHQCSDGSPADIHEGLRFEQQHFMPVQLASRSQAVKLGLAPEAHLLQAREFVHPSETDIMPGGFIFASGIAQTYYQTYRIHSVHGA